MSDDPAPVKAILRFSRATWITASDCRVREIGDDVDPVLAAVVLKPK
jgi:hypothetical protein